MNALRQAKRQAKVDQQFGEVEADVLLGRGLGRLDALARWVDTVGDASDQLRLQRLRTWATSGSPHSHPYIRPYAEDYTVAHTQRVVTSSGLVVFRLSVATFADQRNNLYVIATPHERLLIDAGSSSTQCIQDFDQACKIVQLLWEESLDIATMQDVFVTHAHVDHHSGLNWILERNPKIEVTMHPLAAHQLADYPAQCRWSATQTLRLMAEAGFDKDTQTSSANFVASAASFVDSVKATQQVLAGAKWHDCATVIDAPGHEQGQLVLALDDVVFSADLLLSISHTPQIPAWLMPRGGLQEHLDSLARLDGFAHQKLLGGHGPILDQIAPRLQEALEGHEHTLHRICRSLNQPKTIAELCHSFHKGQIRNTYYRLAIVEDISAHVEYLLQRGMVSEKPSPQGSASGKLWQVVPDVYDEAKQMVAGSGFARTDKNTLDEDNGAN